MSTEPLIVTRPDGSIDSTYYQTRGRNLRSRQAFSLARRGKTALRGLSVAAAMIVVIVLLPMPI